MNLLCIHGAGCLPDVFDAQRRSFANARSLRLPGHGTRGTCSTIAEFTDAVERDPAFTGAERIVLCGSSMGGAIALELGLRGNPHIAGIIAIGCGARLRVAPALFDDLTSSFDGAARRLATMFFADPTPERVAIAEQQMLQVGQEQTIADFRACDAFDATERLGALRCPLLVITGDADRLTPPKHGAFLAGRVTEGRVRILPGAGHLAMLERPVEANEAIHSFVTGLS